LLPPVSGTPCYFPTLRSGAPKDLPFPRANRGSPPITRVLFFSNTAAALLDMLEEINFPSFSFPDSCSPFPPPLCGANVLYVTTVSSRHPSFNDQTLLFRQRTASGHPSLSHQVIAASRPLPPFLRVSLVDPAFPQASPFLVVSAKR